MLSVRFRIAFGGNVRVDGQDFTFKRSEKIRRKTQNAAENRSEKADFDNGKGQEENDENNENGNEYIVVTLGNSARMPAFFGQIDLYKEFAK